MEVEAAALPWFEPALDVSALMSAVIIKDKMDIQVLGHFFLQLVQKPFRQEY
jgi:hypothetical protein